MSNRSRHHRRRALPRLTHPHCGEGCGNLATMAVLGLGHGSEFDVVLEPVCDEHVGPVLRSLRQVIGTREVRSGAEWETVVLDTNGLVNELADSLGVGVEVVDR